MATPCNYILSSPLPVKIEGYPDIVNQANWVRTNVSEMIRKSYFSSSNEEITSEVGINILSHLQNQKNLINYYKKGLGEICEKICEKIYSYEHISFRGKVYDKNNFISNAKKIYKIGANLLIGVIVASSSAVVEMSCRPTIGEDSSLAVGLTFGCISSIALNLIRDIPQEKINNYEKDAELNSEKLKLLLKNIEVLKKYFDNLEGYININYMDSNQYKDMCHNIYDHVFENIDTSLQSIISFSSHSA